MWRERMTAQAPDWMLADPATPTQIAQVEAALGVTLPPDLASLLAECNGVIDGTGTHLIWTVERMERDNLALRRDPEFAEMYMPFDALLFFGDVGNGDQWAFAIVASVVRPRDIFWWSHENDSRTWAIYGLKAYLEAAAKGGTLRF